jgi:hypothetical protein
MDIMLLIMVVAAVLAFLAQELVMAANLFGAEVEVAVEPTLGLTPRAAHLALVVLVALAAVVLIAELQAHNPEALAVVAVLPARHLALALLVRSSSLFSQRN